MRRHWNSLHLGRVLPISLLVLMLNACGPDIIIRHMDPSVRLADVWIDGHKVGTVEYDERIRVRVKPGRHVIKTTPVGMASNPWIGEGGPPGSITYGGVWTLVLEQDAILTLLPRPPARSAPVPGPTGN